MDEARLIEKLRLIEALFAGATTAGEKVAADRAKQRILERLRSIETEEPPREYRFTMGDMWNRKVFVALLRRYGLTPYRYRRQRYTTVMARVSPRFVEETLWPEFQELSATLDAYLSDVTERVVSQVIHKDSSEATVINEQAQIPARTTPEENATQPEKPATPPNETPSQPTETSGITSSTNPTGTSSARRRKKRRKKKRRGRR